MNSHRVHQEKSGGAIELITYNSFKEKKSYLQQR